MPKVRSLNPLERKKDDIRRWIRKKKADESLTDAELGSILGITQQAMSQKIRKGSFSYTDLVLLFRDAPDDEIVKLLRI